MMFHNSLVCGDDSNVFICMFAADVRARDHECMIPHTEKNNCHSSSKCSDSGVNVSCGIQSFVVYVHPSLFHRYYDQLEYLLVFFTPENPLYIVAGRICVIILCRSFSDLIFRGTFGSIFR